MTTTYSMITIFAATTLTLASACITTPNEGRNETTSNDGRDETDTGSEAVVELAVRQLNDGQDVTEFEAARDAFVARLREQDGVEVDREFEAFFDFGAQAPPAAVADRQARLRDPFWREDGSDVADVRRHGGRDAITYVSFPERHRRQIHSTNPLQRWNREIERRVNVVGLFPNKASVLRRITMIVADQHDE